MNRLFLLVAFLVLGKISYSQYPLTQNLGSDSTIVVSKGALQSRLIPIVVSDTNAANAQRMKSYPGAQLFTTNGNFYYRNSTATKWILVSSGSAGPVNIYNTDGTLTGNRVLTGAGNSLYFDGISGLGINTPYDSLLTVDGGIHATGGLRVEKLTTSPGTKALRIDGQGVVSVADTSVVTGTVTSVGSGYGLSGGPITTSGTLLVDSATLSNYYLRRKDSLTATNSLGYVTKKILADTAAAIRASDAGGSVTSVATNNGTGITGGTITTSGTLAIDTTLISTRAWRQKGIDSVANLPRVTSVGLTMPAAFNVAGSPVTSSGTLAVTAAGLSTQYIRGDGQLANFPGGGGGGGSSVVYYFNGGTNQGTFVGNTYYEMSKTAIVGTAANFTINADGYITQFITDAGDPALLNIPAGNWNFEMYFSASSGGGSPSFYVELYKYDGTTFTLISSSSSSPEGITGGTATDLYLTALAVPATSLTLTDRLAVRVYVTHSGRTITLHTQDNTLCQVTTTFTTGITALNGLTDQVQYFATGTSGTDFNISSASATHTFNLPTASATNRGALSSSDWTTFNSKISPSDTASMLAPYLRKADTTAMLANYVNNVGYGLSKAGQVVSADSSTLANYFLRRKDSLTSTNLLGYVTRTVLADTAAAIRASAGTIGGSGTTNRVSKFTASGTIGNSSIEDSSVVGVAMTISSFANVGIGTATPSSRLEVSGNATIKTNFASLTLDNTTSVSPVWMKINNGGGNYLIGAANNVGGSIITSTSPYALVINAESSRDVVIGTNNLERVRFDSTGKVGIGTTTIDSMLTVAQGVRFQRGVRMSGLPSAPGTKALRIDANGTLSIADTTTGGGGGISGSGTTNYIAKFTSSTAVGDSRLFDDGTVTFLGNGDVNATPSTGIFSGTGGTGTNIAGAELRLRGGASTGNASGGIISFYTSAAGSSGTGVNTATERARITTEGRLGIGTTSPINRFHSVGDGVAIQRSSADAFGNAFDFLKSRGTATSPANVNDGDGLLQMRFAAYSGGDYRFTNIILGTVDGTFTSGQTPPSRLGFFTNTAGGSATERLRITSGGSIGIGTTTIGSTLQVNGNAAIGYSASTAAPTNGLAIAGNVGIGNTTSAWGTAFRALQIGTGGSIYNWTGGNLGNVTISSNAYEDASLVSRYINTNGASSYLQNNGEHRWSYAASGTAGNAITYTVGMSLNSSGNLGINTTTIGSRLQVNGNAAIGYSASTAAPTNGLAVAGNVVFGGTASVIANYTSLTINGTSGSFTEYQQAAGNTFRVGADLSDGGFLYTQGNTAIRFGTNGSSERMRITNGGNVGIGTTTIGSKLQVNGNAAIGYSASTAAPTNGLAVSGNLGVGITAPTEKTEVSGTGDIKLKVSTTSTGSGANASLTLNATTEGQWILQTGNAGAGALRFYDVNAVADRMRILSTGDVVIGTTTSAGKVTIQPANNAVGLSLNGSSLTSANAQSLLDLSQTWNTTGNPTAIKLNITNTASGASAYLMDLQVGGTTQFRVTKDGAIRTTAPTGGTADNWKFGTKVASSVVFDDNDYLEVEVGGTLYRVALVNLAEPEPEAVPASSPEDRRINLPAKTSSQRIQELENEIQELRKMVNFLMPISKK